MTDETLTGVSFRSSRLEGILGTQIDTASADHIRGLVAGGVIEAFDLDFKEPLYGNSDKEKRDLAGDVCALANTAGGLIVLGIAEDKDARAIAAPGVQISDAEVSRMRQIVASGAAPLPDFDVRLVPADDGALGYILVVVPPSPAAPHAVIINDGLRYPRRNGATTRYLSESEVATAYRQRLLGLQAQTSRLEEVTRGGLEALDRKDQVWAWVATVPDRPGEFAVNSESWKRFRTTAPALSPTIVPVGVRVQNTRLGRGVLHAGGAYESGPESRVSYDLHGDGASFFAHFCSWGRARSWTGDPNQQPILLSDEVLYISILSGLIAAHKHAAEAFAGSSLLVNFGISGVAANRPNVQMGYFRHGPLNAYEGAHGIESDPEVVELVSVSGDEQYVELVRTVHRVCTQFAQEFGLPELPQVSLAGEIRLNYWSQELTAKLKQWAADNGVTCVDE